MGSASIACGVTNCGLKFTSTIKRAAHRKNDHGIESIEHRTKPSRNPIPAGEAKGLEPVPDTLTKLPWVKYPRDGSTCAALAAIMEHAQKDEAIKKLGPEAVHFFASQTEYLRALASVKPQGPAPDAAPLRRRRTPAVKSAR